MMKPMATTCMATSLLMPNSEHASGMSSSDPPATPDAPQYEIRSDKTDHVAAHKGSALTRIRGHLAK